MGLGLVWAAVMVVVLVSMTGCGRKSDVEEGPLKWTTNTDDTITITGYRLEGTKGRGPTFGGRPTAVWKTEGGTATNGTSGVREKP